MFFMSVSKSVRGALFAVACGGMAVIAGAATTPKPPATICIGSNCATAPAVSGDIKWTPGFYVSIKDPGWDQATAYSVLDQTGSNANVKGIQVMFRWADLEGATAGDYSKGFAAIDALLSKMGSEKNQKHLIF